MDRLKLFKGEGAFARARALADAEGLHVSGTYEQDGAPVYFLTPPDAEDESVEAIAFRIREGRDMGDAEKVFKAAVARHMQRQSA